MPSLSPRPVHLYALARDAGSSQCGGQDLQSGKGTGSGPADPAALAVLHWPYLSDLSFLVCYKNVVLTTMAC